MSQCDSINDNGRTFFVLITSRVKKGQCPSVIVSMIMVGLSLF